MYGGVSIQPRINVVQGGGGPLGGSPVGGGAIGGAGGGGAPRAPNVLMQALQQAQPVAGAPHQLSTTLCDGTKVIFRRDIGERSHPIRRYGPDPVDHYNVEVQKQRPGRAERYRPMGKVHIVVNKDLQPIRVLSERHKEIFNEQQLHDRSKP